LFKKKVSAVDICNPMIFSILVHSKNYKRASDITHDWIFSNLRYIINSAEICWKLAIIKLRSALKTNLWKFGKFKDQIITELAEHEN
jgi:hypothetical protein